MVAEARIEEVAAFINKSELELEPDPHYDNLRQGYKTKQGWDMEKIRGHVKPVYNLVEITKMLEVTKWDVTKFKDLWCDGRFMYTNKLNDSELLIEHFAYIGKSEDDANLAALSSPSSPPAPFMCPICTDEFEPGSNEFVKLSDHKHGFCRDCLEGYLTNHSLNRGGFSVKCPHHECKFTLDPDVVKSVADGGALTRMKKVEDDKVRRSESRSVCHSTLISIAFSLRSY